MRTGRLQVFGAAVSCACRLVSAVPAKSISIRQLGSARALQFRQRHRRIDDVNNPPFFLHCRRVLSRFGSFVCLRTALACSKQQQASSSAQEVKEEPDDTALRPTEAEVPLLESLRAHGVPTDDAVQSLRRKGHNFTAALKYALDMMTARNENRQEDMVRLESEKEKDRVADEQRLEEKTLTVLGDIQPQFQEVRLCMFTSLC